ncbi:MAG: hypothetical protein V3V84_07745 [Candidatus Bathyarchaeia archaeon]
MDFTAADIPALEKEYRLAITDRRMFTADTLRVEIDRIKGYQYIVGERLPYLLKK